MSGRRLSRKNRWWFRVIAILFVPLFVLCGLEGALRLTGYGYPTSFFLERHLNGERVLIENEKFGWRFFPREMARSPSPLVVRATKPAGTYRIFLFGESAALGDPRPAYGVGRYLEALLRERFSGLNFEVVCVAMTAINSHAILPIARECARYQGDLWILYMGNNEMEGPFGANPILGARAPRLSIIRATLALRAAKLGQLIEGLGRWIKGRSGVSLSWEGMKMFLDHQLPPNDPGKQAVYAHFRKNLEDIVLACFRSGSKPILCTVASNLKDCSPFGSLHAGELKESDRARWEALYHQAQQLQSTNEFQEARQLLAAAARIDSQFAELQFRAGQCGWGLTNYAEARSHFEQARDLDALPFRADASLNAITRDVAREFAGQGARLVDAEAELAAQSPGAITGEEFFYDHVHLNFDGNYRLARLLALKVEEALPASIARQRKTDWASAETCERSLGLTDWNRNSVYESMLQRLFDAPFTNQLNHLPRAQALVAKIKEVRDRMHPRLFLETRATYEEALARNPRDYRLCENFAEFLEATGNLDEAVVQWRRVESLLPHHHAAYFHAGRLLSRQKKYPEAKDYLLKALHVRPDLVDGRIELGQVLYNEGKPEEALAEYAQARSRRPDDARVLVLIANALAAQGKRTEATASLREAIRLRPSYWEARYLLGVELATTNQIAEALEQFKEVIRLRPDYAVAHFNLGVAFAKQERLQEAAVEFQETLRLDPNHQLARKYLQGLEPLVKPGP